MREYKSISIINPYRDKPISAGLNPLIKRLNEEGKHGWEAVYVQDNKRGNYDVLLMRKIN